MKKNKELKSSHGPMPMISAPKLWYVIFIAVITFVGIIVAISFFMFSNNNVKTKDLVDNSNQATNSSPARHLCDITVLYVDDDKPRYDSIEYYTEDKAETFIKVNKPVSLKMRTQPSGDLTLDLNAPQFYIDSVEYKNMVEPYLNEVKGLDWDAANSLMNGPLKLRLSDSIAEYNKSHYKCIE